MKALASAFRAQFDTLAVEYERRLQESPEYAAVPPQIRQGIVRRILGAVLTWLESDNDAGLLGFIQATVQERIAHGQDVGGIRRAVGELDLLIEPLLADVTTAKRTWRTFFKIQELISQVATEYFHASEIRLRQMVERSPVGIFHTALDGAILDANPAFLEILGYASPALINQAGGISQIYEEANDRQRLLEQLKHGPVREFKTHFRRADGGIITVAINVWTVEEGDSPVYLEGILEDITEREQAAAALRETEERFRAIYEGSNDAIMLLTPEGFFDCNQQTLTLFGFDTKAEFTAVHPAQVSPPFQPDGRDSMTAAQERIETAYREGHNRFDWVHRRIDGTDFPAEVLLSAFDLGGKRVLQATVRDITQRKLAEQMLRDSEARARESLARREREVQTSIEIAQNIATAPELDELLRRVVTLIKERFGYYHAQIFRYDAAQDAMALVAGYGEPGRQMLAAGHKLPMGRGVVGTSAATGRAILAANNTEDKDWRPNPSLPETKGELAVPIKLRDQILGILDVQSDTVNALTTEDQLLMEGLCGQIAVAMDSTRLLAELRLSQADLYEAMRIAGLGNWEYDVPNDRFVFNDQFYALFHTTATEVGGYTLSSAEYAQRFVYPEDLPVVGAEIGRALASTDRHYERTLEHRILYADGGIGYITVHIHIDRDAEGRILRYYGVNENITERKLADIRVQETLQELERLYRATTRDGWQVFRETGQLAPAYHFDRMQVQPATDVESPQVAEAVRRNALVSPTPEESVAAAPLTVRGEIIGALGVFDDPQQPLSADELTLLQEIIEQGSLALESARLYQDTQRRAAREQLVGEITGRIRETLDLNTVLQTAVREMGLATGADVVEVRLRTGAASEDA